uniref:Uncharacterized protein n=1 Tax=Lactuca sativa TaxID=4236 RepID=A0A9R1VFT0_LACSA|nr:hypothetical protein LSAT_V11C500295500 [Lactuca sativa]
MADDNPKPSKKTGVASDPKSPFYIHASDYPKQMQVNDTLIDWSQEMMNFLFAKNKKPEKTLEDYMSWMWCDAMVKGWITKTMEKEISLSSYPYCSCNGCTCDIGKSLSQLREKERLYEFLMGLDSKLTIIRTQILSTNPIPSLKTKDKDLFPLKRSHQWRQLPSRPMHHLDEKAIAVSDVKK